MDNIMDGHTTGLPGQSGMTQEQLSPSPSMMQAMGQEMQLGHHQVESQLHNSSDIGNDISKQFDSLDMTDYQSDEQDIEGQWSLPDQRLESETTYPSHRLDIDLHSIPDQTVPSAQLDIDGELSNLPNERLGACASGQLDLEDKLSSISKERLEMCVLDQQDTEGQLVPDQKVVTCPSDLLDVEHAEGPVISNIHVPEQRLETCPSDQLNIEGQWSTQNKNLVTCSSEQMDNEEQIDYMLETWPSIDQLGIEEQCGDAQERLETFGMVPDQRLDLELFPNDYMLVEGQDYNPSEQTLEMDAISMSSGQQDMEEQSMSMFVGVENGNKMEEINEPVNSDDQYGLSLSEMEELRSSPFMWEMNVLPDKPLNLNLAEGGGHESIESLWSRVSPQMDGFISEAASYPDEDMNEVIDLYSHLSQKDHLFKIACFTDRESIRRVNTDGNSLDIPLKDNFDTALHVAAQQGNVEGMRVLIELGANLHTCNNLGMTPFLTAVYFENIECVKFLLSTGQTACNPVLVWEFPNPYNTVHDGAPLWENCSEAMMKLLLIATPNLRCLQLNRNAFCQWLMKNDQNQNILTIFAQTGNNLTRNEQQQLIEKFGRGEWLKLYKEPMSLKELSRIAVRRELRNIQCEALSSLELPATLMDYVCFKVPNTAIAAPI